MGTILPIRRYAPFDPEQTRAMGLAFDAAWKLLAAKARLADSEAVRAQLGRKILELAQQGENDPDRLANYAVAVMRM
jgi:hypothetical protein